MRKHSSWKNGHFTSLHYPQWLTLIEQKSLVVKQNKFYDFLKINRFQKIDKTEKKFMKALSNFAYSLQARQNDRLFDEDLKQLKGTALQLVCCALLIQDGFFEMLSPEIQNNWAIKRLIKKEKGQVSNIAQQLGSISQTKKINNFPRKGLVLGDKEQQATFVEDN